MPEQKIIFKPILMLRGPWSGTKCSDMASRCSATSLANLWHKICYLYCTGISAWHLPPFGHASAFNDRSTLWDRPVGSIYQTCTKHSFFYHDFGVQISANTDRRKNRRQAPGRKRVCHVNQEEPLWNGFLIIHWNFLPLNLGYRCPDIWQFTNNFTRKGGETDA